MDFGLSEDQLMLEETVRELRGDAVEEGPSATLDLPVPMSIPRSYIRDENLRMEVYRKLAAENPEAHTLHYNLGLIYLKLSQYHEAEQSLLRAQQCAL